MENRNAVGRRYQGVEEIEAEGRSNRDHMGTSDRNVIPSSCDYEHRAQLAIAPTSSIADDKAVHDESAEE